MSTLRFVLSFYKMTMRIVNEYKFIEFDFTIMYVKCI